MPSPDQYWSILINIDQYWSGPFFTKIQTLSQSNFYAESWSILINIDLCWSILIRTFLYQSQRLFFKTAIRYAESWSILINIVLFWSILIKTFLYQSWRLCFKTAIMPSPDQYWSLLINIDQYWSKFINLDQYWSILINIDQYWSKFINLDQHWSIFPRTFYFERFWLEQAALHQAPEKAIHSDTKQPRAHGA